MKTATHWIAVIVALVALAVNLHSQSALPKSPADQLKTLKTKNLEVLELQKQTLLKLDELEKQAEQIRFLAARS